MWAKSFAAALFGLPVSVGIIGLIVLLWPGDLHRTTLPWLLMSFPLWIAVMSLAFIAKSGWRAWAWMGGGTVLLLGLIHAIKWLGWVEIVA